jgi:hypothetical protein
MARSKGSLTPEQEAEIRGIQPKPADAPPPATEKSATDSWVDDMNAAEAAEGAAQ